MLAKKVSLLNAIMFYESNKEASWLQRLLATLSASSVFVKYSYSS